MNLQLFQTQIFFKRYLIICCISELLNPTVDYNEPVDIFAIGFEEIVDLSAGNIVNARWVC